jgi:uncharacterized membrane protein/general stress protein YciG/hemerythrin-like domain-containing protein
MAGQRKRGFAAMDAQIQQEIARRGGQAAHKKGTAHEFTPEEARVAGHRGGKAVSRDRQYMALIGRRGGRRSGRRSGKTRQQSQVAAGSVISEGGELNATMTLRADHRKVEDLFHQYDLIKSQARQRGALVRQLCRELDLHAEIEEELFYPAVRAAFAEEGQELVAEALREHGKIKELAAQLWGMSPDDTACDPIVQQLKDCVQHHVQEEEQTILPKAEERLRDQLDALGARMRQRKQQAEDSASETPGEQQENMATAAPAGPLPTLEEPSVLHAEYVEDTKPKGKASMSNIEQSIDVNVPVRTAYNQWTQFEDFPRFMEGVQEVRQLDDKRLHWRANIGGKEKEWDAEITEQVPDQRIAWKNTTGATNAGVVTFHRLNDTQTRVMLQVDYDPEGVVENVGDMIGVVSARVRGDLKRFKEFIESHGQETGAWRGEIQQPRK